MSKTHRDDPDVHGRTLCNRSAYTCYSTTVDADVDCEICVRRLPAARAKLAAREEQRDELLQWVRSVAELSVEDKTTIVRLGRSEDWTTVDLLAVKSLMRRIAADLLRRRTR